jgi:hypothetical protein
MSSFSTCDLNNKLVQYLLEFKKIYLKPWIIFYDGLTE